MPLPERILLAGTTVEGLSLTAVSYHAPPGVSWGIVKPRQAVTVARWPAAQHGPVLLGADASTPLIGAAGFAYTRAHWHSGDRRLNGEPGDDLLFGPGKSHPLPDGLRRWLADHPAGQPFSPVARKDRWRSRTLPVSGRTHQALAGGSTPSG